MRRIDISKKLTDAEPILPGELIELYDSILGKSEIYMASHMQGFRCESCDVLCIGCRMPHYRNMPLRNLKIKGRRLCAYHQVILKNVSAIMEGL